LSNSVQTFQEIQDHSFTTYSKVSEKTKIS